MAGTITHHKIGKELYEKLPIDIDKDIFSLACQGHDLLYFIKLKDLPKFKKTSLIVKELQDKNFDKLVKKFQEELIKSDNLEIKSFFYGYLIHHITDSIFHPFIIYHSGNDKDKHEILESVIDTYMTKNIHSVYKEIPKVKISKETKDKIETIFSLVYEKENVGNTLVINMNNVRGFLRIYRTDKTGIKRIGYLIIDVLFRKKYEFLSFHYSKKVLKAIDINKKAIWFNPLDNKRYYSSIVDLYNESINKAYETIIKIEKSLQKKKTANISLDISAVHGRACNQKYELKYFIN